MAYKIIISELAKKSLNENLDYLANRWNTKVTQQFLDKVDIIVKLISNNPDLFIAVDFNNHSYYKVVITKHVTLYYSVDENYIKLELFWNNYKNPKALKRILLRE
ncbi:type II toxin-antitoxin system RelE/ParE family toxin [Algibacter sp. 2305UL17-15]|uniref:type II toxin-antitoxin system RelE/ParE family toxin n=1 Tax=Algibacter sp. 2305UL17-15 TaxID=3231268 RepID=UPI0034594A26